MTFRAITPWDQKLFLRSMGLCVLLALVVVMVQTATDEPGSTADDRLVRLGAISPVVGLAAVGLVLGQGAKRGEWLALRALGLAPWAMARGASAAAALFGTIMSLVLLVPFFSLRSLFPALPAPRWLPITPGLFISELGFRWDPQQPWIEFFDPVTVGSTAAFPRLTTWACFAGLSLVLPLWATLPCSPWQRGVMLTATIGITLLELHKVAIGASHYGLLVPLLLPTVHLWHCWRIVRRGAPTATCSKPT